MRTLFGLVSIALILLTSGCAVSDTSLAGRTVGDAPPVTASPTPQAETSLREARVLAIIDYADDRTEDVITAPGNVSAAKDFQVEIKSFGGGCEREGDTGTIVAENSADVMVYDFTTATHPGVMCTAILKRLSHTVTLRFSKPGEALIRVWGRRVGGNSPGLGVPVVLEKRITVK